MESFFSAPFCISGCHGNERTPYLLSGAAGSAISVMEQEIIFSHALSLMFPYCDPVAIATENAARQLTAIKVPLQSVPYRRH